MKLTKVEFLFVLLPLVLATTTYGQSAGDDEKLSSLPTNPKSAHGIVAGRTYVISGDDANQVRDDAISNNKRILCAIPGGIEAKVLGFRGDAPVVEFTGYSLMYVAGVFGWWGSMNGYNECPLGTRLDFLWPSELSHQTLGSYASTAYQKIVLEHEKEKAQKAAPANGAP